MRASNKASNSEKSSVCLTAHAAHAGVSPSIWAKEKRGCLTWDAKPAKTIGEDEI